MNTLELDKSGYVIIDEFLSPEQCKAFLGSIGQFRKHHSLTEVYRPFRERSLRYWVINGEQIEQYLP
ncbi:MAG: hypothetical protein AB4042_02530, partial [Leptolyngbyaceae cyanobacterium]